MLARIVVAGLLGLGMVASLNAAEMALPGGEEVAKAVAARRGKTELSKLAARMKPGTWAELKAEMPKGLWVSPVVDGGRREGGLGGFHIAGWTDDAHWDSRTGQFLYMGMRQTRQFIAYSEEKNAWRAIELDRKSDNPCFLTYGGHIYGNNGFDAARSRFYHRYNGFKNEKMGLDLTGGISYFDTKTEKWTKLPPLPGNGPTRGMAFEYFDALRGLVILDSQLWTFDDERQKWEVLGPSPVDGYSSLFRHNPFRQEVLIAGGKGLRTVARLKKDGKVERLKDFPFAISTQNCQICVDPASGRYLIKAGTPDVPQQLYEFDGDKNEYRVVKEFMPGWPFTAGGSMPVCAYIPEYGVVMWAEAKGTFLYKHAAASE